MTFATSRVELANGVTLSYAEQGRGAGPTVVFHPGPTDAWRSYAPVFGALDASVHAIAVSARGHGDSDKPASGYGVNDFATDLGLFLDALGIDRAVLAGHSGSCLVLRRVAIDCPERVAGLVLEASPSTLRGVPALEDFVRTIVDRLADPIDLAFARSIIADTSSGDLPPTLFDDLVADLMKVPAAVWRELFGRLVEYDDLNELAGIRAPTLLVWGDADTIVPREMQDALADRINSAELLVYSGSGHTPRWEQPARFANDVAGFVHRCRHATDRRVRLQTDRLTLRPFRRDDVAAFETFARDARYRQFLGEEHPAPATFVNNNLDTDGAWVIEFEQRVVGSIFLDNELACLLDPEVHGMGIASEAARVVLDDGFDTRGYEEVVARTHPDNLASHRALARLGFRRGDDDTYRLHRSDWHRDG
jgi:pimeloyl-ACP methyl ester carboxylesterase